MECPEGIPFFVAMLVECVDMQIVASAFCNRCYDKSSAPAILSIVGIVQESKLLDGTLRNDAGLNITHSVAVESILPFSTVNVHIQEAVLVKRTV